MKKAKRLFVKILVSFILFTSIGVTGDLIQPQTAEAAATQYKTSANLNMRTGPSTKYKVIKMIPKGKSVSYISKSGSWYKVKYGNKTGYTSSKYLKKVATAKKATAKAKTTATTTTYETTTNLNMRTGASTKYKRIATIPKGKSVSYISKSGSWYKVKYGSKTGYVSSKYLKKVATAKKSTKAAATTKTTAATIYKPTTNLNMRTGASTKYKRITTIPKGKSVSYISKSGSWYKVKYGSKTGYVSSKYLKKTTASTKKAAPTKLMNVPLISQYPELPAGCEVTALAMALNYYGVKVNKTTLAKQMPYDKTKVKRNRDYSIRIWGDPEAGYVGTPFGNGITINPKPLKKVLDKYRKGGIALTGKNFNTIEGYVKNGKPTLVWFTLNYQMPTKRYWKTPKGKTIAAPRPLHCLVITGVDSKYVYFNDSDSGKKNVKLSKDKFVKIYNAMGKRALVVN